MKLENCLTSAQPCKMTFFRLLPKFSVKSNFWKRFFQNHQKWPIQRQFELDFVLDSERGGSVCKIEDFGCTLTWRHRYEKLRQKSENLGFDKCHFSPRDKEGYKNGQHFWKIQVFLLGVLAFALLLKFAQCCSKLDLLFLGQNTNLTFDEICIGCLSQFINLQCNVSS